MAGDESFDPKSWLKKESAPPAAPASNGGDAIAPLWQDIAASETSPPVPPEAASAAAAPRRTPPHWQPFAASAAILIAGSVAAYAMRADAPPNFSKPVAEAPVASAEGAAPTSSTRTLVLAGIGGLASALETAGIAPEEAGIVAQQAAAALGGGGGEIRIVLDLAQDATGTHLIRLQASLADGSGAIVGRNEAGEIAAVKVAAELSKEINVVRGEIDATSFYSSAVSAGMTDVLIPDFINAFAFDFDLQMEINPGDTFEVAYEQTVSATGETVGAPKLLYASLRTQAKSRAIYRFQPTGEEAGWYDGNGASTVRSFMRTPVDGARISSKFGYRIHPIYGYSKLHGGTDFAAPQGTPIYASGDAVVEFAGMKGCNGNFTRLHHDNGWYTHYLHQVKYADGIAVGARVKQGQVIGFVGTTGCSTGPHLHYEVVIDGAKVDPLSIKTESGRKGIEGAALAAFKQERDRIDVARARQAQ